MGERTPSAKNEFSRPFHLVNFKFSSVYRTVLFPFGKLRRKRELLMKSKFSTSDSTVMQSPFEGLKVLKIA